MMDSYKCAICQRTGDFICYCSNAILCVSCIGKHLLQYPGTLHKPVPLSNKKLRNLLASSLSLLKFKESEILSEAEASLAREKGCKAKIAEEIALVSKFCQSSLKKILSFTESVKSEVDEVSLELQTKVKSACEAYISTLSTDQAIQATLNHLESLESIQNYELSLMTCTVSPVNIRKALNDSFYFEIGLINTLSTSLNSYSYSNSLSDISQSVDSPYWKRARTRVPTKTGKKILDSCVFAPDENRVLIYNLLKKETDSLKLEVSKGTVCTVTNEGSVIITGGVGSKTAFVYEWCKKTVDQVDDMGSERGFHSAVNLGDFVYVIGGEVRGQASKLCERFDIIQKHWQDIGDLNTPRLRHSACVYRGRIFVAGGCGVETLEVYNTVSNKFSVLRTVLSVPGPCLMFPVEDFMIIFHSNVVSSFDPAKFTCQSLSSLDESDWYINGNVVVNKKVASFIRNGSALRYDIENGKWVGL